MAPTTTPRARRVAAAALTVAVALLLSACLPSINTNQKQVQTELNADRKAHSLRTLGIQADAQAKAQAWAEKLARENTLYHSNLASGIKTRWCSIGENVGYGPNVPSIEDAYMNSPGHRKNILASKWNGVGVGYAKNGNKVFTVQVFIQTC